MNAFVEINYMINKKIFYEYLPTTANKSIFNFVRFIICQIKLHKKYLI